MYCKSIVAFIFSSFLVMSNQFAFAGKIEEIICPAANQLKQLPEQVTFPYGFNSDSKRIKTLVILKDEDGKTNLDWLLQIHPVEVSQLENPQEVIQNTIDNLVSVSRTPFMNMVFDGVELPVCAYTLPGHPEVNAIAYYIDSYDDDDDYNSKPNYRKFFSMLIEKQLNNSIMTQ